MNRTTAIAMTDQMYRELQDCFLPHVGKDDTRPILTGVRIRTRSDETFALDAVDNYSAIRATGTTTYNFGTDQPLPDTETEPIDVIVDGAALLSLKPGKKTTVLVSAPVDRTDEVDYRHVTVTDGTTTAIVRVIDGEFPNLDDLVTRPPNPGGIIALSARRGQLPKFSKVGTTVVFMPTTTPGDEWTDRKGIAFGFNSLLSYRGLVMPVAVTGNVDNVQEKVVKDYGWRNWEAAA